MTPLIKSQVTKVFWITFTWTLISIGNFFIGYGTIISLKLDLTTDPMVHFKGSILTGIIAGILGGIVLVQLWEKWLRTKPYGWTLRSIFITYVIIFILVAFPTGLFFSVNTLKLPLSNWQVWKEAIDGILNPAAFVPFFYWLFVVIATMIVMLVNDKYGPGVFQKFLLGRYFNPKKEERVFMFLDLRSSTSIAEKIGEEKYFSFLKEVYKEATPGILKYEGEIYQYVGDEIVVSWSLKSGIERSNCIQSFFEIRKIIAEKKSYFLETFGVIPEFKAGLHYGHVMAGEIGVVKREIAFSGDVMNTTSRIQEKCNELGVDILVSRYLIDKLNFSSQPFQPKEMGEMVLKGKEQRVGLFTLET